MLIKTRLAVNRLDLRLQACDVDHEPFESPVLRRLASSSKGRKVGAFNVQEQSACRPFLVFCSTGQTEDQGITHQPALGGHVDLSYIGVVIVRSVDHPARNAVHDLRQLERTFVALYVKRSELTVVGVPMVIFVHPRFEGFGETVAAERHLNGQLVGFGLTVDPQCEVDGHGLQVPEGVGRPIELLVGEVAH